MATVQGADSGRATPQDRSADERAKIEKEVAAATSAMLMMIAEDARTGTVRDPKKRDAKGRKWVDAKETGRKPGALEMERQPTRLDSPEIGSAKVALEGLREVAGMFARENATSDTKKLVELHKLV
jgi:hypothetical protein